MKNGVSPTDGGSREPDGDGGILGGTKDPLLGADSETHLADSSACREMRQHLKRQLNGRGRVDLATGDYI